MIEVVGREVGVEDESPMLLVGISESAEDEGLDFFFQCDLRRNEYPANSNWPEGESYSVSNEDGRSSYGAVEEVEFRGNNLRVLFREKAVQQLGLADSAYSFEIDAPGADLGEVRRQLHRVLTLWPTRILAHNA